MSSKQKFVGKKFCEICRTAINWTKEDIAFHEQSRKHIKNKERELEFRRQKAIREQEQQQQSKEDPNAKLMKEIEEKAEEAMRKQNKPQNVEIPPVIGPSQGYRMKNEGQQLTEQNLKELKKQKKREELGSEFGSSFEESDSDEDEMRNMTFEDDVAADNQLEKESLAQKFDRVWYLSKDEKTGRLFFYNQISQVKRFEKPIGLKLLEEEQKIWDDYMLEQAESQEYNPGVYKEAEQKSITLDKAQEDQGEAEQETKIQKMPEIIHKNDQEGAIQSAWIEVDEEDNFFNKYAATDLIEGKNNENGEDEEEEDMEDKELVKMARIEIQIEQGKITNEKQMIEALLEENDPNTNKQVSLRKKNDKIKKLIEDGLDVYAGQQQRTFKKQNWLDEAEDEEKGKKQLKQEDAKNTAGNSSNNTDNNSNNNEKGQIKQQLFKKRIINNKTAKNIEIDL